jgi:hypothetical protein
MQELSPFRLPSLSVAMMLRPSRIEPCRDTPVGVRVLLGGRIEPARAPTDVCGKE